MSRAKTAPAGPPVVVEVPADGSAPAPAQAQADRPEPTADPASVEAIILAVGRPVGAERIAIALGLLPDSDGLADAPQSDSPPSESPPADATPTIAMPAKKPRRAARVDTAAALKAVQAAIADLNGHYESTGRSFRIEHVAGGYRVMTLPRHAAAVARFHAAQQSQKLSRAAVESLAIIAYKQPITRAELESIRGVACGEVLKTLLDRRLVTIKGRAEELGRPMLYGTTRQFLDHFGLASVADLPTLAELRPTP